jgi:hypothetical protein
MKLHSFDKEGFKQIKSEWLKSLSPEHNDISASDYIQLFDMIESTEGWGKLGCRLNLPVFQAIVDDHGSVWAMVETIESQRESGAWIKMMGITMSPQHEIGQVPDGNVIFKQRLSVFATFLMGVFTLTKANGSDETIKIYTRIDALIIFLSGMYNPISVITFLGTIKEVNVSIEDRWLVFSEK